MGSFFVLLGILLLGLYGLNALRGEAIRLVLDPLQRMLKIVLRCKLLLLPDISDDRPL
jgi:hypothetical protein